jgi:hypothetical protein
MREARHEAVLRWVCALVGTVPACVLLGVAAARSLPLSLDARFVIGVLLPLPAWVAACCTVSLSRSATQAITWCVGAALIAGALATMPLGVMP